MLWGGLVRMLVLHHVTYSINSLCHFFGRRPFETGDESRNLAWLAPLTFGEAWHNGHHAFPTSARHGLERWQIDISAGVIVLLERVGLAWDVVRVDPARLAAEARGLSVSRPGRAGSRSASRGCPPSVARWARRPRGRRSLSRARPRRATQSTATGVASQQRRPRGRIDHPVCGRPTAAWKAITAFAVPAPNWPSIVERLTRRRRGAAAPTRRRRRG